MLTCAVSHMCSYLNCFVLSKLAKAFEPKLAKKDALQNKIHYNNQWEIDFLYTGFFNIKSVAHTKVQNNY